MTQLSSSPALVLRRVYDVPRERVFDAWTDPKLARQFLGPYDVRASEVEMDIRVGGTYRIVMQLASGDRLVARGVYKEVRRPERLSMTWRWEDDDPAQEHDTLLTLEFFDRDGATELVLTHELFTTVESRDNHEQGWTSIAHKLEGLFKSGVCADIDDEKGVASASVALAAAPDRVFGALASPEVVQWWVRPGVFDTREWTGDVRVGGSFRASGIGGGQPYALEGEFVEIDAPRKLVHTWRLAGTTGAPTTVAYYLEPIEGGTHLTVHHTGFTSLEACANTCAAWETSLECLREMLRR